MAVTAERKITITFSGDVIGTEVPAAASNTVSPGQIQILSLVSGANTITLPTGGSTPKAVTIIPPAANVETLTLKGVTGDTGVAMHAT